MTVPDEVPVMPLPGAVLFPRALLPLYIFEPRYREMLDRALQDHRMFCVTLIKPSCADWFAAEDFFHVARVERKSSRALFQIERRWAKTSPKSGPLSLGSQ
jgi:Lon protease-like protein